MLPIRTLFLAVCTAALSAQCAPPSIISITEPFSSTHYLGTPTPPSPDPGFAHLFDVVVDTDVTITRMECLLYDDGVNPSQIGNTATVEIWLTPGSYVPNVLNQPAWFQLATGTLTVAASSAPSPIVFTPGFTMPVGTWGVSVLVQGTTAPQTNFGPLHPLVRIPCISAGNPAGCTMNPPLAVRDQFLDISAAGIQRYAWVSGASSLAINLRIFYSPGANAAFWQEHGTGCYRLSSSFYEWVRIPGGQSDFNGVGIALTPAPTHYNVGPTSAGIAPVSSAPLQNALGTAQLGANESSAALTLPFTFNYPAGTVGPLSTSQIVVSANGGIWLGGSGSGVAFNNGVASFLLTPARLAVFWGNLDPSVATGSGSVHFDVDPANQFVTVTWQGVQEWTGTSGGPPMTFQAALFANGLVELRYGNTYTTRTSALVGFTPGGGDIDPGSRDLVVAGAVPPFAAPDGAMPLHLTAGNRPVIGRTFDIRTDTIRAGATAGLLAFGTQGLYPGVSLAPFGMPPIGASVCLQHVALPVESTFFLITGPSASVMFAIPNVPAFNGVRLEYQSFVLSPGLNPVGLIASNGMCVSAGLQ